jgi:glycosyltransferase involved in cell wall biosynthesis
MIASYPRVSVVIACYDQAAQLEITLTSFLRQKLPTQFYELIVVDDHSPTYAVRDVVARYRLAYPEVSLIYVRQYRTDGGRYGSSARAKNIGLRLSRGEYVFFNNAEIVQAGESLSYILETMAAAQQQLCLRGRVLDIAYEQLKDRTQAELEQLHDNTDRKHERVATADHAGLAVVSRSLLLALGGNDERFDYWGKEDLDLAARLKRAGATYLYDEKLKSFHIAHPPNHVKQGDYLRMVALLDENNSSGLIEANRGHLWGALYPPPQEELEGTVIVQADSDLVDLGRRLEALLYSPGAERREVLVFCLDEHRATVEAALASRFRPINLISLVAQNPFEHASRVLRYVRTESFYFLPTGSTFDTAHWHDFSPDSSSPFELLAAHLLNENTELRVSALSNDIRP